MKTQATYFQESEDEALKLADLEELVKECLDEIKNLSFSQKREAILICKEKFGASMANKQFKSNLTWAKKAAILFNSINEYDETKAYNNLIATIYVVLNSL